MLSPLQVGKFTLPGEGLRVGRDSATAVTHDYAGDMLWAFKGGIIKEAIADVSGEAYLDLELEALGMMKRD